MNLLDIRKDFVMRSGRYDLATPEWEDNGADFFIRAGQRMLDKKGDWGSGQDATFSYTLAVGVDDVFIPLCWLIERVFIDRLCFGSPPYHQHPDPPHHCPAEHHHWVEVPRAHSRDAFRCCFGHFDLSYWTKPVRELPRIKGREEASSLDIPASSVQFSPKQLSMMESEQGLRLFFNLPHWRRHSLDIQLIGKFFAEPLLSNDDTNYWSEQHPELLLKAAFYELEVFYRNSEGAKDWMNTIMLDLQDIEQMQLFQNIQGKNEMRGFY